MSIYIHKSHNVSVLLYHLVCPAKYRAVVFDPVVDQQLIHVCQEISRRYSLHFVEIGTDKDHVHFLIQSIPMYSPTKIARVIKSLTARYLLKLPQVKKELWGGEFWGDGYYIASVGKHGSETAVAQYLKHQGQKVIYTSIHKDQIKLDF